MKVVRRPIPNRIYAAVHRSLPVVCVDIIVTAPTPQGRKFLLVRRKNRPKANVWWFPGGRVLKNERLASAAIRKLKEETGFRGKVKKFLGFNEWFCKEGYFPGTDSHTIIFVFLIELKQASAARLDSQSSRSAWFSKIPSRLDSYPKRFLRAAGFKK